MTAHGLRHCALWINIGICYEMMWFVRTISMKPCKRGIHGLFGKKLKKKKKLIISLNNNN